MPRNSGGTYTLPAGNPVISGTTITSTWANTTLNDVATAMTDSLARDGKGAMLAPLEAFDGTSSAPGITWATEQSSGLYRKASHDFAFQVNSNTVMEWLATGVNVTGFVHADASAGATFVVGVRGVGADQGDGVQGQGGTTSGTGVTGFGGLPNGRGAAFTGVGTGAGITAIGASGPAIDVSTGHAHFTGGNPAANAGFTNIQTPVNMTKAQFVITLNGTSTPTLNAGFNVASSGPVALSGSAIVCSFNTGAPMASGDYAVSATLGTSGALRHVRVLGTGTGAMSLLLVDNSNTTLDPASGPLSGQVIYVTVQGAQ